MSILPENPFQPDPLREFDHSITEELRDGWQKGQLDTGKAIISYLDAKTTHGFHREYGEGIFMTTDVLDALKAELTEREKGNDRA